MRWSWSLDDSQRKVIQWIFEEAHRDLGTFGQIFRELASFGKKANLLS